MNHGTLSIVALTLAATLTACNSGNKNQAPDGWVIKNEVTDIETIDLEEIADIIDVKSIESDEPVDQILAINGNSNDFIGRNGRGETFYHIKDGKLVEKLNAKGNGPNEYHQLWLFSYLPAENLFYGCDNMGKVICFQTSPFKFEWKAELKNQPSTFVGAGRDQVLFTAHPPIEECKDVEIQELGNGASIRRIKDSSAVYSFDGHTMTKLFCVAKPDADYFSSIFTRSGNDVLMALQMPQYTIYRYADGKVEKVVTIDYGKMEKPEARQEIETQGDRTIVRMITDGDYSTNCQYPQLSGSTLAYWHRTVLNDNSYNCLAVATPNSIHVYSIKIRGLFISVTPNMVDNGVYTMLIQGDWESKINSNEELSPLGKRIIEAMKNSDENPVVLQFRLKDKYLNK